MERKFKASFEVRYYECGVGGYLRPSVYLCYTQEAATCDARVVGWADRYWVVRRTRPLIHRPLTYPTSLTMTTWVPGLIRRLALLSSMKNTAWYLAVLRRVRAALRMCSKGYPACWMPDEPG